MGKRGVCIQKEAITGTDGVQFKKSGRRKSLCCLGDRRKKGGTRRLRTDGRKPGYNRTPKEQLRLAEHFENGLREGLLGPSNTGNQSFGGGGVGVQLGVLL